MDRAEIPRSLRRACQRRMRLHVLPGTRRMHPAAWIAMREIISRPRVMLVEPRPSPGAVRARAGARRAGTGFAITGRAGAGAYEDARQHLRAVVDARDAVAARLGLRAWVSRGDELAGGRADGRDMLDELRRITRAYSDAARDLLQAARELGARVEIREVHERSWPQT